MLGKITSECHLITTYSPTIRATSIHLPVSRSLLHHHRPYQLMTTRPDINGEAIIRATITDDDFFFPLCIALRFALNVLLVLKVSSDTVFPIRINANLAKFKLHDT